MHYVVPLHSNDGALSLRTVVWLVANPIDGAALGLWCRANVGSVRVETLTDVDRAFACCKRHRAKLLIVDPAAGEAAVTRALAALHSKKVGHVLVLDRRPREGRLVEILREPGASYLSRTIAPTALAAAIEAILAQGTRVIDPALTPRLRPTARGYEFHDAPERGSVAALTVRERQVMRLLAQGKRVRDCAAELGLAHSTIDNHKARIMKKLGIHKASELTCRAVREGLIAL